MFQSDTCSFFTASHSIRKNGSSIYFSVYPIFLHNAAVMDCYDKMHESVKRFMSMIIQKEMEIIVLDQ